MDFCCCSNTREKNPKRRKIKDHSVQPVTIARPELLKCAENSCEAVIVKEKLGEWRAAICGRYIFRFCSDECWTVWLKDVTPNQSIIQFGSPNTPAIEPNERLNDIPLLNI